MNATPAVQYRIIVAKKDERTVGADDAAIVISVPFDVAHGDGFDATAEYMRGRLKAAGPTGQILDVLRSGAATRELAALAATIDK